MREDGWWEIDDIIGPVGTVETGGESFGSEPAELLAIVDDVSASVALDFDEDDVGLGED